MPQSTVSAVGIHQAMFEALESPGLLPLVRVASTYLNAPIVLTDDRYHLIALYPPEKIGDPVYDCLMEKAYLPIEVISQYQKAYLDSPGRFYKPFYADTGPASDWPRIFAEVHDEQRIYGHVGILTGRLQVQPEHWLIVDVLLSALRIKMNVSSWQNLSLSNSLHNLLDSASSWQSRELAAMDLHEHHHIPAILIAAPLTVTVGHQAFISVIISHLEQRFKNIILTIFENDLIILITRSRLSESESILHQKANQIAAQLRSHSITCGAVEPIKDLLRIPEYFWQAHLTARIASDMDCTTQTTEQRHLCFYQDLAPRQMYRQIIDSGKSSCFINPLLGNIREFDKENKTDLYSTLEIYCLEMFEKNRAAERLHVHRNTLLYRLRRIEELFQVNLDDHRTLHHLLVSFNLIEDGLGGPQKGSFPKI